MPLRDPFNLNIRGIAISHAFIYALAGKLSLVLEIHQNRLIHLLPVYPLRAIEIKQCLHCL